jgi:type III secretory pathway component EscR
VHESVHGTFRTWCDVGFESVMSSKADVYLAMPFKLIFFVLVDGWSLVAGSLMQSYGG